MKGQQPEYFIEIKALLEQDVTYSDIKKRTGKSGHDVSLVAGFYGLQLNYGVTPEDVVEAYSRLNNRDLVAKELDVPCTWVYKVVKEKGLTKKVGGNQRPKKPNLFNAEDEVSKYWLGWLASKAEFRKGYSGFQLYVSDSELVQKLCTFLQLPEYKTPHVSYYSRATQDWLQQNGIDGDRSAEINNRILSPAFLRGAFDAIGQVNNEKVSLLTFSEVRANQMQRYLIANGIVAVVYPSRKKGYSKPVYVVRTEFGYLKQFKEVIYQAPCTVYSLIKRQLFNSP